MARRIPARWLAPTVEVGFGLSNEWPMACPAWHLALSWWLERIFAATAIALWIGLLLVLLPLAARVVELSRS